MNIYLLFFFSFLDLLILFTFFNKITNQSFNKIKIFYFIFFIVLMSFINNFDIQLVNTTFAFLSTLFISYYVYKINLSFSIIVSLIYVILSTTAEMITYFIINIFVSDPIYISKHFILLIIISCLIKGLFMLTLVYMPFKNLYKKKIYLKVLIPLMILPICFIFLIDGIYTNFNNINLFMKISIILLFLANFIVIYLFYKVNQSEVLNTELLTLKEYEKINKLYYDLLMDKYNSNRKYIHDFNKHVNILNEFIESKDYENMNIYVKNMLIDSNKMKNKMNSGNKNLDIVLSTVFNKYDYKDIKFNFERIDDLQILHTYLYSIVTILYNVIENAAESCIACNGGTITIAYHLTDTDYFIFKVSNTSKKVDVNNLITTKDNPEKHGLGLISIQEEVRKLDGLYNIEYDEDKKEFITCILLPISILYKEG